MLRDTFKSNRPPITIETIQKAVAAHFSLIERGGQFRLPDQMILHGVPQGGGEEGEASGQAT